MTKSIDLLALQLWDESDPLRLKRQEFAIPQNKVYLDGNSLGAMPRASLTRINEVMQQQWSNDLISSWNSHNWIDLPTTVGEKIAKLIGAAPHQTICCDSISVNLFKLIAGALLMQKGRHVVLSVDSNFPTDLYIAQGLEQLIGKNECQLKQVNLDELEEHLDEQVAVLMLTHVDFRTGSMFDMKQLTQLAHQHGILVLWDLAHSAGALAVELDRCQVDFAVGCGYKYLNGGPGAPAFIYINKRHQQNFEQPLYGWMGHAEPFSFNSQYLPARGIEQCLVGTPSVLAMSVLDSGLDVFENIHMSMIREKSVALSSLFLDLIEQFKLAPLLPLISPKNALLRGSQLSFAHRDAYGICQALIEKGVIADFRAPDVLRFGFTPLYTRYADIYQAVQTLANIISSKMYLQPRFQARAKVT